MSVAKAVKVVPYLNVVHVLKPNLVELLSLYNASFGERLTEATGPEAVESQARYCATKLLSVMHGTGRRAIPVTLGLLWFVARCLKS